MIDLRNVFSKCCGTNSLMLEERNYIPTKERGILLKSSQYRAVCQHCGYRSRYYDSSDQLLTALESSVNIPLYPPNVGWGWTKNITSTIKWIKK